MSMDEACQILNVTKEADLSKITKVKKKKVYKIKINNNFRVMSIYLLPTIQPKEGPFIFSPK